jgi:predicted permease
MLAVGNGDGFAHFRVVGRPYVGEGDEADDRSISVGYFETLRAKLLRGRYFNEEDTTEKPRMAIINSTMAQQLFDGVDPIGQHILNQYDSESPIEIVGVVDDIKEGALDSRTAAAVYSPYYQSSWNSFYVVARTTTSEGAMLPVMAKVVHEIDPELIVDLEQTMSERIDHSQSAYLHRTAAAIVGGFAGLALLLGTVGLYGVISYSVGQRTREIGVRIALGAPRSSVYRLIMSEAGWLAVLGLGGGVLCSAGASILLRGLLFGVSPWDMGTLVSVGAMLFAAALLASYLPARRAAYTNPTEALRAE